MFQLKYSEDFKRTISDIPFWKKQDDIPPDVKKFIKHTSDMRVIYDEATSKFFCGKCLHELSPDAQCGKCGLNHKTYTDEDVRNYDMDITRIKNMRLAERYDLDHTCRYFAFDIIDGSVFLYHIIENVSYYNPLSAYPYKNSRMTIDESCSYYIEKDGMTNLATGDYTPFIYLDEVSKSSFEDEAWSSETTSKEFDIYEEFELNLHDAYFYTANMHRLKDTFYRYTKIWEMKKFLKTEHCFTISQFSYYPLYYPQFEYLVNYKLYHLAWYVPFWFEKKKSFNEIFGIDKKYLPFMVEHNINSREFRILQVYPTTDIELLRFFSRYSFDNIDLLKDISIDLEKLRDYLVKHGSSYQHLAEYFDYIAMAKELNLDLKDRDVIFPSDLRKAHDDLFDQLEVIENPEIDKKIKSIAERLTVNRYEDETYVIYPASSIAELVEESRQQKNCVRTYADKITNEVSQIYFMRKKTEIAKSLVTVEVHDKKITQARTKYNELPSPELMDVLNEWERRLKPVVNR